MSPEPHKKSLKELSDLMGAGEISSLEITRSALERIDSIDPSINAYVTVHHDLAIEMAKEADQRIASKKQGPLTGATIAIKDNMCLSGHRTTCSSKILENFYPPYDATVVKRIKQQGMVILGSTNMDEFAMGSSTENSAWGPTKNPWDFNVIPGGSSGGAAAAVASGQATVALGSDTGGSIRLPASYCGVSGMKPTYGAVSRYGLVAFASSLDQIGPIGRNVEDIALVLNMIVGQDEMDSTSVPMKYPDFTKSLNKSIKGMKLGLPEQFYSELDHSEVKKAMEDAKAVLKDLGAEFVELSLPHLDYSIAAYYIIAPSEASSNLARYDGVKYGIRAEEFEGMIDMYCRTRALGFGHEVKRRIMLGTYALSSGYYDAYYLKAAKIRTLISNDFKEAFNKCDAIFCPTSPTPPFKLGEKADDPIQMYLMDVFTIPVNMAGLPGLSIPGGFSSDGLPIGIQFIAPHFEESRLIKIGSAFQNSTDFHTKTPKL